MRDEGPDRLAMVLYRCLLRQTVFQKSLTEARESGRMKLLGTYDGDELYAVTKTEPEVR